MPRKLLFSIGKSDMDWEFFRSGGKGGQNQNKRDTGVRCRHKESGAVGESREHRTQLLNRRAAFVRCVGSKPFQSWLKIESARRMGKEVDIDRVVEEAMQPDRIRCDYKINGKWVSECKSK